MNPIFHAWAAQVEITNACTRKCAHCSRAVRHVREPYFMPLHEINAALKSLQGFPGKIGCMGGEPTLHPDFDVICHLYQQHFPRQKCGLWSSGGKKFEEHKELIAATFGILLYNDHTEVGKHQPWMIAMEECVPDKKLREKLIRTCWVQEKWSPAVNPKGAFFCEFAAVMDLLFDGPGGYAIEPGWWNRTPEQFQDQIERYCHLCSAPLPFMKVQNDCPYEYVSIGNSARLLKAGSPWAMRGKMWIVDTQFTKENLVKIIKSKEFVPWEYLGEKGIRDKEGKISRGYAKKRTSSLAMELSDESN